MPTRRRPTVLVVGGGFAGRSAIRYFISVLQDVTIVLVDDKDFFEFTPSLLRCIVFPDHLKRITFEQNANINVSFMRGKVTYLTNHEATVARNEVDRMTVHSVPFDFCVWATGVQFTRPISSPAWQHGPSLMRRRGEFSYYRHRVLAAAEVLVIGAGPIGVELAAELVSLVGIDNSPRITLAASPRGVLPRFPKKAGNYAKSWLIKRGVRVIEARLKVGESSRNGYFQYSDISDPPVVVTADLVFECTGAKSNNATNALVDGGVCEAHNVQRDGSLMVLDTLQLPNARHIFVAGDASRIPGELEMGGLACEKTAYAAEESGKLAACNVAALMRSESLISGAPNRLLRYPRDAFPQGRFPRLFAVSLYKYHGALCVGPVVITGMLPAAIKYAIEFFGVPSAQESSSVSMLFRFLERLAYAAANFFAYIFTLFERHPTN